MPYKVKHQNELKNKSTSTAKLHKNKKNNSSTAIPSTSRLLLLPIICVVAILPLIMRIKKYTTDLSQYSWFANNDEYMDFFQYYKQEFLIFVAAVMMIIIIVKAVQDRKNISFSPIFIPLAVYALLSFLSSILSKYRYYSFFGSFEQFESIIAILGYCLITYYIYLFVQSEENMTFIVRGILIGAIILSFISFLQTIGHDLFATDLGRKLIVPSKLDSEIGELNFSFGKHYAYGTLYNPNYVGMYAALVAPLFLTLSILGKKNKWTVFYILGFVGAIFSIYGSHSSAGMIATTAAVIFGAIFLWRYLVKYKKLVIPVFGVCILAMLIVNFTNQNFLLGKVNNLVKLEKVTPALSDIQTKEDCVRIEYSGNTLQLQSFLDEAKAMTIIALDQNGELVTLQLNADGTYTVLDDRFPGFVLTACKYDNGMYGFNVLIDGNTWYFAYSTSDRTYYYYNSYGKFDKIEKAPSAVFTGYEHIFTDRGFMWSRTIPLLKEYPILGIGANNFILAFPQKDYVNQYVFNHGGELVTRPHSLYLQIAIQNGVAALLAFLVFYLWYFISAVKLYIKGRFDNPYSILGLGILAGTVGYMICGIANDSLITVAPVFWAMVGLGIAANSKAKQLMIEAAVHENKSVTK